MTVLARPPRASRPAASGERDQLGRIPRDLWEALAADEDARARYYGKVYRAFTLDQEIDEQATEAKYADGILELKLSKKAPVAAKRITIQ